MPIARVARAKGNSGQRIGGFKEGMCFAQAIDETTGTSATEKRKATSGSNRRDQFIQNNSGANI